MLPGVIHGTGHHLAKEIGWECSTYQGITRQQETLPSGKQSDTCWSVWPDQTSQFKYTSKQTIQQRSKFAGQRKTSRWKNVDPTGIFCVLFSTSFIKDATRYISFQDVGQGERRAAKWGIWQAVGGLEPYDLYVHGFIRLATAEPKASVHANMCIDTPIKRMSGAIQAEISLRTSPVRTWRVSAQPIKIR